MQHKFKFFLLAIMPFFFACEDFIEPSIEHTTVSILAPANKLETNSYQQTFWWNPLINAKFYRLQVVSPNFDSVSKLLLDTLIRTEKFVYTLDPGKYHWRVRGENGSSASNYSDRFLEIFPSTLTDQILQVNVPASGLNSSRQEFRFEWLRLFGAKNYRIQIDNNNFQDEKTMELNVSTDNLSYLHSLSKEGTYQYRVRAENDSETSKWSSVGVLTYDNTGPAVVTLSSPTDKQQITKPVKLTWNKVDDAVSYEISIYKADQQTLYNQTYPLKSASTEHAFTLGDAGETIAWRIRAFDRAGNASLFSEFRTFIIQ